MEQSTMMSAGATMQSPPAQDVPSTPIHPITWPLSCFTPAKAGNGTYQGSVLAASLTPGAADIWSAAHHQWKQSQAGGEDQAAALGHDDSGISPGRTSSSGPSSVGGSPPAAKTAETLAIKEEQPEKDQEMSIHDEDSFSSEDAVDPYGRGSHPSSPNGQPAVHLRCPFCGSQDFDSIEHMLEHCRAHTDTGPPTSSLNCSVCSLASVTKEAFLTHLASHLPQQHHCLLCGFATKSSPKLRAHLAEVHGVDPAETNNEISTRGPAQGKVKSFKCKQCMFVAHTKLDFWAHSKEHIKGDKVLSCPRCPFVTEYKHHLEYHLRNHSGSKPFKCPQCPYTCVNKSMLNSHLKSHSNVYQYRCADCNYVTKYCHSLKLHLRKYLHNPAMVLNPDGTPNPLPIIDVYGTRRGPKLRKELELQAANAQQSPLKCPQCDFQSMSESHIQQHMLSVHPQPPPQAQQQQPPPQQQQQAPMNPLKEYLSWMYAQQMGLMHHFSTTAALTSNPLDLRKEQPQQPASPSHSPAKSRRKTKAPYRLLEQSTEQEERVASPIAAQPPPPVVQPEAKKPEEKMLSCSYCDIFFKDAVMYAMHMGYHGYKDPFHCNMCGEKTQDRLSFFLHIARSSHL